VTSPAPLLESLRVATWPLHQAVEKAGIMPALLRGQLHADRYVALLRNLHAVYAALESALRLHQSDPRVGPVSRPVLYRQAALEADLATLCPAATWQAVPLQPAAAVYAARLRTAAQDDPVMLVAHAYVRYLGDLNGGQALARITQQLIRREDGAGTRFYDFGDATEVAQQAASLRRALNGLPLSAPESGRVVAEAQWAFRQHGALFEELDAAQPLAGPSPAAWSTSLSA
jgi:heme oxygenase (biliverdin-producing, ferredoxin)